MSARIAAYYAPEEGDPLWTAGNAWLGRDPETGADLVQPGVPGIAEITAEARVYGFHATLKPPFRVATSWAALFADAERLAGRLAPFDLPPLHVANLSGFVALRETRHCPALHALAEFLHRGARPAPRTARAGGACAPPGGRAVGRAGADARALGLSLPPSRRGAST